MTAASLFWLTEEEAAFRAEVDEFVTARQADADPLQYYRGRGGATRELYKALGDRGWLSLCWPEADGGAGKPVTFEYLLWDSLAYHRAARPDLGPGIVTHVIRKHGTADQRARFLPDLRTGRVCFALGYSEPEAGSDLTGLRTRARPDGDVYVVTGEKCWTSDAHNADYLWLLCRTGEREGRQAGLTLLVLDMTSLGVTVAPIRTIDGHRLNEVFLDGVVVPADNRIGAEGAAWAIIREALAVERHIQLLPGRLRRDLEDLWAIAEDVGAVGTWRHRLLELTARVAMCEASSLATLMAVKAGSPAVTEAAATKLIGTTLAQEIPRTALELGGAGALTTGSVHAFLWQQSIMETIAGGSTEILLSLVARSTLGLGSGR